MTNKPTRKADPILVIGFTILIVIMSIGIFTPRATPEMSPMEVYQLGMVKMVSGVLIMTGSIVMIIIAFIKLRKQNICPSCGTMAQSVNDKFCRKCGTPFAK